MGLYRDNWLRAFKRADILKAELVDASALLAVAESELDDLRAILREHDINPYRADRREGPVLDDKG